MRYLILILLQLYSTYIFAQNYVCQGYLPSERLSNYSWDFGDAIPSSANLTLSRRMKNLKFNALDCSNGYEFCGTLTAMFKINKDVNANGSATSVYIGSNSMGNAMGIIIDKTNEDFLKISFYSSSTPNFPDLSEKPSKLFSCLVL